MPDPMILIGAVGEPGWAPGGSASSLFDGIGAAGDGKSADWNQSAGVDVADSLHVAIAAHPHLPSSIDVTIRHVAAIGNPTIEEIGVYDASSVLLYQAVPSAAVPSSIADDAFSLVQQHAGAVDSSGDWSLILTYRSHAVLTTMSVDQVSGLFDARGEHGSGPGGQLGQNASILLPTMVSL